MASPFAAAELPHAGIVAGILLIAGVIAGTAPDADLRLGLRHRGLTHSLWAAAVMGLLILVAGRLAHLAAAPVLALVVSLAWVSHIAADLTNRTSVGVLWPRRWGPYRFGVREGSMVSLAEEWCVRLLVVALVLAEISRYSGIRAVPIPWRA